MKRLFSILAIVLFFCCFCVTSNARAKYSDYVQVGGKSVKTSTLTTYSLMETFPSATVTVYLAGTTTLAPIYTNNSGTVKANPFTADTKAYFEFYADNGLYDIKFSGTGITAPFTRAEIALSDPTDSYNPISFGAKCDNSTNDLAAFTAIKTLVGSANATIVIPKLGPCRINTLSIPANITLDFSSSGGIYVNTSNEFTHLGDIKAPANKQIFYNVLPAQGTLTLSANKALVCLYPQWLGAVPSATSLVQKQAFEIAANYGIPLHLVGNYTLDNSSSPITLGNATDVAIIEGMCGDCNKLTFTSADFAKIKLDFTGVGSTVTLKNFHIFGPAGTTTPSYVAGDYGIYMEGYHDGVSHGVGNLTIESVRINQLGDNAIRLQGPTGPSYIINPIIFDVGDYGIKITSDANNDCPQNMTIFGGSIQGSSKGGVSIDGGTSTVLGANLFLTDIELHSAQTKPVLHLKNTAGGNYQGFTATSFVDVLSVGTSNIYFDTGAVRNTVTSVLNTAHGAIVLYDGPTMLDNTIFEGTPSPTALIQIMSRYFSSGIYNQNAKNILSIVGNSAGDYIGMYIENTSATGLTRFGFGMPPDGTTAVLHQFDKSTNEALIDNRSAGTLKLQTSDKGITINSTGTLSIYTIAFASLGTPASGTEVYCSDCDTPLTQGATCASSGDKAGAWAKRIRAGWKCY